MKKLKMNKIKKSDGHLGGRSLQKNDDLTMVVETPSRSLWSKEVSDSAARFVVKNAKGAIVQDIKVSQATVPKSDASAVVGPAIKSVLDNINSVDIDLLKIESLLPNIEQEIYISVADYIHGLEQGQALLEGIIAFIESLVVYGGGDGDPFNMVRTVQDTHDKDGGFLHDMAQALGKLEKDQDGDGIPDRFDDDRDGDGVPNSKDSKPDDPNESIVYESEGSMYFNTIKEMYAYFGLDYDFLNSQVAQNTFQDFVNGGMDYSTLMTTMTNSYKSFRS